MAYRGPLINPNSRIKIIVIWLGLAWLVRVQKNIGKIGFKLKVNLLHIINLFKPYLAYRTYFSIG